MSLYGNTLDWRAIEEYSCSTRDSKSITNRFRHIWYRATYACIYLSSIHCERTFFRIYRALLEASWLSTTANRILWERRLVMGAKIIHSAMEEHARISASLRRTTSLEGVCTLTLRCIPIHSTEYPHLCAHTLLHLRKTTPNLAMKIQSSRSNYSSILQSTRHG